MHSIQAKLALLFQRKQDHRLSLEIFIKEQIQELEANQQHRTARAYRSVLNSFSGFLGSDDFQLQNLDDSVVKRFETYLKKNGKSLNTVSFYMRNLRAVYNKACKKQLIIHSYINPFEDTFTGIDKTSKRAVKQNIIKRLFNLDLSHNRDLEFSKRLFLFSFYTRGMSFVDMSFLRKRDLQNGYLTYRRRKTGQRLEVKVTDEIAEILNYYKEDVRDSPYLLPIITNVSTDQCLQYESALRTYNNRLAQISKLLKLPSPLTSYVARHSWATIAKSKNIPISVISESLGHNSQQTTQIYLASFNSSILHKANLKVIS